MLSLLLPWSRPAGGRWQRQAASPIPATGTDTPPGPVWLVGAGPGDPELITVKAVRLLQQADVVVHDRLVAPDILALCPARVIRIDVGKRPGHHPVPQAEIEALLIAQARAGRRVVRLKGGDPGIFGRGGEELQALRRAGITVEVVPGITAAAGCAAAAGFALTQRGLADSVCLVTATHEADDDEAHWASLAADRRRTLVFYMGRARLARISERLRAHGLPAETPAALIENGTTHCQRQVFTTLAELAVCAQQHELANPCLLVLGPVVQQAADAGRLPVLFSRVDQG